MPFPPTFDGAWDNTFPPDTQAANQLGLDLRNFRRDAQQRMSLLSGTFANRPTNMDAIFGGAGFGVLYFSTDTAQIFQWNGAAWVDITSNITGGRLSNVVPVVTNGAGQDGVTVTIPAGALVVGTQVNIEARVTGSTNNTIALFFGASQLVAATGVNPSSIHFEATLLVTAAAAQQGNNRFGIQETPNPNVNLSIGRNNTTEAIANAIVVKTRQTAGAGTITHDFISVVWK